MKKHILWMTALPFMLSAQVSSYTNINSSFNQTAFVPDMALIIDGSYVSRSITTAAMADYSLAGLPFSDYNAFNSENGFNFNYAELTMHSDVDQLFTLDSVFHFITSGVEIEEAYFTTRKLPFSLQLKGGKFKSAFGRINQQHQHVWDFADAPMVYNAFLTAEGLNHVGVQLQWLVPTPWYMMLGVELMQSGESGSFTNQSFTDTTSSQSIEASTEPGLTIAYMKNSFDIQNSTLLLGLSAAQGTTKSQDLSFDGMTSVYGMDLMLKSYFNSYSYLSWQSELLYRQAVGNNTSTLSRANLDQSGAYTQFVYVYNQNWRSGIRYDAMFYDTSLAQSKDVHDRYTAMCEYRGSEFSKIRAQYSYNTAFSNQSGQYPAIYTFMIEVNFAIGSHGAHAF